MKFMVSEDQFIEYLYSLGKDDYMIDFSIRSKGLKEDLNNRYEPTFDWKMKAFRLDQSISFENRYTRLSYQYDKDKTDKLSQSGNDDDIIESVSWISYRQHFFSSILVPKSTLKSAEIKSFDLVNDPMPENSIRQLFSMSSRAQLTCSLIFNNASSCEIRSISEM